MLQFVTCVLVLGIIVSVKGIKPRSVNVELETILKFNEKDNEADVKLIDDVQKFLAKVRNAVEKKKSGRRSLNDENNLKFTDFVREVIVLLKNYDSDDLEDITAVIDDEIRKYHYKGCKFYELVENNNLRRFVADKLGQVKEKPAEDIRQKLDNALNALENAKFDSKQSELIDYLNSLYTKADAAEFRRILDNLEIYNSKSKRANIELINIVRDSIRTVIFDHYSGLNTNTRRDLKTKLETIWDSMEKPNQYNQKVWTIEYHTNTEKSPNYYAPVSMLKTFIKNAFLPKNVHIIKQDKEESKVSDKIDVNKIIPVDTQKSVDAKVPVMDNNNERSDIKPKYIDDQFALDVNDDSFGIIENSINKNNDESGKKKGHKKGLRGTSFKSEPDKKKKVHKKKQRETTLNSDKKYGNIREEELILIEKPVIWNTDDSSDKDSDDSNSEDNVSSVTEVLKNEGYHKKQHKNHHTTLKATSPLFINVKSEEFERNNVKYTKRDKSKTKHKEHKKRSSFITLYPEAIKFTYKKRHEKPSTKSKQSMVTLWEEDMPKKYTESLHRGSYVKHAVSEESQSEIFEGGVEIPVNDYRISKQNNGDRDIKYLKNYKYSTNTKYNINIDAYNAETDTITKKGKKGVKEYLKSRFESPYGAGLYLKFDAHQNTGRNLDTTHTTNQKIHKGVEIRARAEIFNNSVKHTRLSTEDDINTLSKENSELKESSQDKDESNTIKIQIEDDMSNTPKRQITVETFPSTYRKTATKQKEMVQSSAEYVSFENLKYNSSVKSSNSIYSPYLTNQQNKTEENRAKASRKSNTLKKGGKVAKSIETNAKKDDNKRDPESEVMEILDSMDTPQTHNIYPRLDFWEGTTKNTNTPTTTSTTTEMTTIPTSATTKLTTASKTTQSTLATKKTTYEKLLISSTKNITSKPPTTLSEISTATKNDKANVINFRENNQMNFKMNKSNENFNAESLPEVSTATDKTDVDPMFELAEFMQIPIQNGVNNKNNKGAIPFADDNTNTIDPAIEEQMDDLFKKYGLTTLPPKNFQDPNFRSATKPTNDFYQPNSSAQNNVTDKDLALNSWKTTQDSYAEKLKSIRLEMNDMTNSFGQNNNTDKTPLEEDAEAKRRLMTGPGNDVTTKKFNDKFESFDDFYLVK